MNGNAKEHIQSTPTDLFLPFGTTLMLALQMPPQDYESSVPSATDGRRSGPPQPQLDPLLRLAHQRPPSASAGEATSDLEILPEEFREADRFGPSFGQGSFEVLGSIRFQVLASGLFWF